MSVNYVTKMLQTRSTCGNATAIPPDPLFRGSSGSSGYSRQGSKGQKITIHTNT